MTRGRKSDREGGSPQRDGNHGAGDGALIADERTLRILVGLLVEGESPQTHHQICLVKRRLLALVVSMMESAENAEVAAKKQSPSRPIDREVDTSAE